MGGWLFYLDSQKHVLEQLVRSWRSDDMHLVVQLLQRPEAFDFWLNAVDFCKALGNLIEGFSVAKH